MGIRTRATKRKARAWLKGSWMEPNSSFIIICGSIRFNPFSTKLILAAMRLQSIKLFQYKISELHGSRGEISSFQRSHTEYTLAVRFIQSDLNDFGVFRFGRRQQRDSKTGSHETGGSSSKYGRKILSLSVLITLIGVCLTLFTYTGLVIMGLAVTTFGFFGGHSIASAGVGRATSRNKAQASSLYLFFYYAGSSIGGTAAGLFWSWLEWDSVVGIIALFLLIALAISLILSKMPFAAVYKV